ncbi:MAG: chemotaxis protein CheD [Desulfobulbaceae bacterium]|nr:MAG: chemotaxis protein CheD [Desulfobulbaceae bacterium]
MAACLKIPFDKLATIVENSIHFPLFRGYTILVLGVGDLGASKNPPELIKTYALGSCVAVILIHPKTRVVGMVHVALPDSTINPQKARTKPGYFADTGIPALIREMMGLGCSGGPKQMVAKIAGGAKIMDPNNVFNIGNRNILAVKKILWKYGVGPRAEDVGGVISRTVTVSAKTGRVTLSSPGKEDWRL